MARTLLKGIAWLVGAAVVLLGAWFGINATDEPLSDEARAALVVPPFPAPSRDNGFLDALVLGAPGGTPTYEAALERVHAIENQTAGKVAPPAWREFKVDARIPRCAPGAVSPDKSDRLPCLQVAANHAQVLDAIAHHRTLLGRYREMREKPRFMNVIRSTSPDDDLGAHPELLEAQRLIHLGAAARFNAGDHAGALTELERDIVFYRRMAGDATSLFHKMLASSLQDRAALIVAELARNMPAGNAALWRRLEALVRPPTREELDLGSVMQQEFAAAMRWMLDRRYALPSDEGYKRWPDTLGPRPWWRPVAPYLYRPQQTANWFAARCRIFHVIAQRPSTEFASALQNARVQADALDPGPVARVVFNPVGWNNPLWGGCEYSDYVARTHARAGVQTLVRLLVKLHERRILKPDEVAAALAGTLGLEHPDPFTGKPMRFDPQTGTIGFEAQAKHISGAARHLHSSGRMALPVSRQPPGGV